MKKLISILLTLCILLSVSIHAVSAYTLPEGFAISENAGDSFDSVNGNVYGYIGDANNDNVISITDATAVQMHLAKLESLPNLACWLSDVDFSGDINISDATAIQMWVAKYTVDVPINHIFYEIVIEDNTEDKLADYLAYKKIIDEQIKVIEDEGPVYYGTSEEFSQEVSSLNSQISTVKRKISALAYDNSSSGRAKRAKLEAELSELEDKLDALYEAKSRANQIDALQKELDDYYNQLFG